jgi:hypothetical protein
MASRQYLVEGSMLTVYKPIISFLSVSPLHTIARESKDVDDSEDLDDMEEATNFTAKAHKEHIEDILTNYQDMDTAKWIANQTADSASVNLKLAKLVNIPHLSWECWDLCLSATPPKQQTFVSVAHMLKMLA